MSGDAEDFDLLAGIYVLGALEHDEAHAVEELVQRDPDMAQSVDAWQRRLAPLASVVAPQRPPADLWGRIAASIGAPEAAPAAAVVKPSLARRAWRSVQLWRAATAATALAAACAGILLIARPEPTEMTAALAPAGTAGPMFLARVMSDGSLMVRPLATASVDPGKDMELWALADTPGAKPVSLGVLPSIGHTIPAGRLPEGTSQLLVSLEPEHGSPTGQPTGPILYMGTLRQL
ncbi:MAG: anti-sigma factor [Alphaproteobacteria bacterium]|nr:anti-sigma factor [Alphaproteobacteria bacterium]